MAKIGQDNRAWSAADFDYPLPASLIAQTPALRRDQSRLLVLDRATQQISHRTFCDLPELLRPSDVLVLNDTRVIPARLRGLRSGTGGKTEIFLLREETENCWWTLLRPAKRIRPGDQIEIASATGRPTAVRATLLQKNDEGHCLLQFACAGNLRAHLQRLGEVPLPPYIQRPASFRQRTDRTRYQTVYAAHPGSVAAPTAGLHFTPTLLRTLADRGVTLCFITLHVGYGTFAPVKTGTLAEHRMHTEQFSLSAQTAEIINRAKQDNRRVLAVGTTTVRVLESVARQNKGQLVPAEGQTDIFIFPPHRFHVVDGLVTNFHLPQSTLLMLASAFAQPGGIAGRDLMLHTYAEAVRQQYRFFSYGDAMFIL